MRQDQGSRIPIDNLLLHYHMSNVYTHITFKDLWKSVHNVVNSSLIVALVMSAGMVGTRTSLIMLAASRSIILVPMWRINGNSSTITSAKAEIDRYKIAHCLS